MEPIEHYRKRILELAITLDKEEDKDFVLQEISHMMIELGKLQNEIIGHPIKTKEEWA